MQKVSKFYKFLLSNKQKILWHNRLSVSTIDGLCACKLYQTFFDTNFSSRTTLSRTCGTTTNNELHFTITLSESITKMIKKLSTTLL